MVYSILHISDLHRSPEDPIRNDDLLSSLQADIDRWEHEEHAIAFPQAIVVSGDLIRGVRLGTNDHEAQLDRQYADALDFLQRLADDVIGCGRSQVVLVPGNHDVDWNRARLAMELVPDADLGEDLRPASFGPETDLRWSWRERRAYRIVDRPLYERRFERFGAVYDAFFGAPGLFESARYYTASALNAGRIGVAAFNSAYGNDCFAFHGAIPGHALAAAHQDLRGRGHDLLLGVWHHNIDGPPYASDYMDIDTVYRLIGTGFRLGLHGHQHRAQTSVRYVQLPEQERLALVSAGSLCAGARELPPGVNRQFNVVVLADDLRSARVHVREIAVSNIFAPTRRTEFGGNSYMDVDWSPTIAPGGTPAPSPLILDAEAAAKAGRYADAVDLLMNLDRPVDSYADALITDAIERGNLWDRAAAAFPDPASQRQLMIRVRAAIAAGLFDEGRALLTEYADRLQLPASIGGELRARLAAEEALRL